MPVYRVNMTTVSWIARDPLSAYSRPPTLGLLTRNGWLESIAYGLYHSANTEPPAQFDTSDYDGANTLKKEFRGFSTCNLEIKADDKGTFDGARSIDPVVTPVSGSTPPFDSPKMLRVGGAAQQFIHNVSLYHDIVSEGTKYSLGETSSLSACNQPPKSAWQTGATPLLPYGSLTPGGGELALAHAIVKFRAGSVGDRIGCLAFRAPNHVPWVWCEALLTLKGSKLTLYGAGSGFPNHAFYVGGPQRGVIPEATSLTDLDRIFRSGLTAHISWKNLSPDQVNLQAPTKETSMGKKIGDQAYTAPSLRPFSPVQIELATLPKTGG